MKKLNARLKGYRTRLVAIAVTACSILLGALQTVGAIDLSPLLGPKAAMFGPLIMAIIMGALREVTTGPPGKKAAE